MGVLFYRNQSCQQSGFSLVEVALALIMIGLVSIPALYTYQQYLREQEKIQSQGNVLVIQSALQKFAYRYGRYPLPADPSLGPGVAGSGVEVLVAALIPCSTTSLTVCQTAAATPDKAVLIGTVPFSTLGLPQKYATDAYKNKFTYAVTQYLTSSTTFSDTGGAVRVVNESGADTNGTASNAHYVIVSYGRDKAGAFTLSGIKTVPCSTTAADGINCRNTATFNDNFGYYITDPLVGPRYLRAGKDIPSTGVTPDPHYDDYIYFTTSISSDIWTRKPDALLPLSDIYNRNLSGVKIGSTVKAEPDGKLDIGGDMRTTKLQVNRLCKFASCDAAGSVSGLAAPAYPPNVFQPEIIAGTPNTANADKFGGGIDCGDGALLIGIKNSDEVCSGSVIPAGAITGVAGPGVGTVCNTGYAARKVINGILQCELIP